MITAIRDHSVEPVADPVEDCMRDLISNAELLA
jgi:hypothetical protein